MKRIFHILLLLSVANLSHSQVGVGKWRDHFSFSKTHHIEVVGSKVYAQGDLGLMYYDLDDETVNKFTKIEGLSDVGISTFAYDKETGCMVIAYTNSNVDLVYGGRIFNLSDIRRSEISGDKNIYRIRFHDRKAYLACGFGVVVLDLARKEISDVYHIGHEGASLKTNDLAIFRENIVVATDSGFIVADKNQRHLNIYTNWTHDTSSVLGSRKITGFECFNGEIFIITEDSIHTRSVYKSADLRHFDKWLSGDIRSVRASEDRLVVSKYRKVEVYDRNLALENDYGDVDWLTMQCLDATVAFSKIWLATDWASLVYLDMRNPSMANGLEPNAPQYDDSYRFKAFDKGLFLAHGSIQGGYFLPAQLSSFSDNKWATLQRNEILDSCNDIVDMVLDPKNKSHMFATAWNYGILEIENNAVKNIYNENNSDNAVLPYILGNFRSVRTGAAAADNNGDCWFTNALQNYGLVVRRKDGSWKRFETNTAGEELKTLMIDSVHNYKWFLGYNKIYIHDGDNNFTYANPNNGSKLATTKLNCMAQDQDNEIWLGTDKGVKVIFNTSNAFGNGGNGEESPLTCNNILYSEGGNIEYLLAYEEVTCITVDGANRKWIGTASGGAFLVSENGTEQLLHFSASNSPLPSDKISDIGIMPTTGEVFIGTNKGIVSYKGTATYAEQAPLDTIYAYPNPVKPDYNGPIAIKGFTRNALVHITDASGHVVFSTRANGGQAIWYGRTSSGRRVASGVYYVFASDDFSENRSVAKVLILR